MTSWPNWFKPIWFGLADPVQPGWRWRMLVGEGMLRLTLAKLLVAAVPLRHWRRLLGPVRGPQAAAPQPDQAALVLARAVVRGAARLPFETKCLPRAIALHTMLRRCDLPSLLVIGVLDPSQRGTIEDLHAWVESGGIVVIGALDQPFHPLVRFGGVN